MGIYLGGLSESVRAGRMMGELLASGPVAAWYVGRAAPVEQG